MIPVGGVTLILSILVIVVGAASNALQALFGWQKQSIEETSSGNRVSDFISAITLAVVLCATIVAVASFVVYKGFEGRNNFTRVINTFESCEPTHVPSSNRMVVLRLDDVQAFGWTDISIRMIEDALSRDMPVVAGVIPKNLGEDARLTVFLKKNDCNVEIAMHGYTHQAVGSDAVGEFALLGKEEAVARIELAKKELAGVASQRVTTFIPPQNQISDASIVALLEGGLSVVSSEGEKWFDYDTESWNFVDDTFVPAADIIADCEASFASGDNLCVIMLHPQDFSNDDQTPDESRYDEYIALLDYLQRENISVLTFDAYVSRTGINSFNAFERDLVFGTSGVDVLLLQQHLNESGYLVADDGPGSPGEETTYFGEQTRSALSEFQIAHNIKPASGYFGSETRKQILFKQ